ncbi:MAG: glycosyltransferase [Tepidibacter sp.]|jgi:glycosyltransferase involved in cell wall biosynthesis|uniref:glycosyltransferase n=1 Tax=Tepidibacter sp. TaxID=2529387 RepID=UPI0025E9CF74|nr:glycosyltransferase [Tepidibacter sp.]MCT4508398.1 glycosyltransferase [Tepidibacter sp.]
MSKVSVIIPTYNYGEFICDAIDSILKQTFKDYEIIIIDDGSIDNTKNIIKKYNDKISYYYQSNQGPASARNLGIKKSTGDYICFLDADDIFIQNKLETQVKLLDNNSNKNIGLLYSDFLVVNQSLSLVIKHYKCQKFISHNEAFKYLMKLNYINTSTVMIVKDYLLEVGLFNEKYKYLEDYDLWVKLGKNHEYLHLDQPLVKTRSHYKNYSTRVNNSVKIKCFKEIKNSSTRT